MGNSGTGNQLGTVMAATTIDHLHPLYLYPSDAPRSLNVGIMLTGTDNYTLWSKAMQLAMLGKNKVGFIDGTVDRDQFTGDLARLWDRCNTIVVSWILCNVSKDLHSGVLFCSDAHLIWEDLKERFHKVNSSRIFQLHKEIFTLVQGVSSVSIYYSRLKDLWDEYDSIMPPSSCTCSKSRDFFEHLQFQRMLQFLMGLNDNYSQARSQILLISQLPTVNHAYAMINQDESQRMVANSSRISPENLAPTALFTNRFESVTRKQQKKPYNPHALCEFCNVKGHLKIDCLKLMKCDFCHKTGHLKINCYKLIGYPPHYKGRRDHVVAGNSIYDTGVLQQQQHNIVAGNSIYDAGVLQQQQHNVVSGNSIFDAGVLQMQHQYMSSPSQQYQYHQSMPSSSVMPMFTPGQHQQLLRMLDQATLANKPGTAHMAGHVQLPTGDSAKVSHIRDCHIGGGPLVWEGEGDW